MYLNVKLLNKIGIITLNKYDTARRLNSIKDSRIAYYKYQGRYKFWFINYSYLYIIQKTRN